MTARETVCKQHYPKRCGSCPIRPQCINSQPYPNTWDSHKAWLERCERAAEAVLNAQQ